MYAERFVGTVQRLASVDVGAVADWIGAIDFADWPQQHVTQAGQLCPAMVTDPHWHGFKARTDGLVAQLMGHWPGCIDYNRLLSVVMPGDSIAPHVDAQGEAWRARVHVPLVAETEGAEFRVAGATHHLRLGMAYLVNTLVTHSVVNYAKSPRIHFMFDVRLI